MFGRPVTLILGFALLMTMAAATAVADEREVLPGGSATLAAAPTGGAEVSSSSFERTAAHTIERLGGEALAIAADKTLSDEDRADRFRAMLARELDIPTLARFAVARGWRRADPADRDAYVDAFSDYILARYGAVLDGARDVERFAVVGARRISDGDATVTTRLTLVDGRQLVVAWRMRDVNGDAKILDIVVEGMSAAQTLRQEFTAVLRANAGRMAALIAVLRERAG